MSWSPQVPLASRKSRWNLRDRRCLTSLEFSWSNDGAIHVASRARIKIISSDARRSLGLGCPREMAVSVTNPLPGRPRRDVDSSTLCERLLGNESVRSCCVGRLRHLRRKGLAPGGLTWWRLVAALAYTSNFCRRMKQRWRDWDECLRVNPAHLVNPFLEKTLRREFDEALKSERAAIPIPAI